MLTDIKLWTFVFLITSSINLCSIIINSISWFTDFPSFNILLCFLFIYIFVICLKGNMNSSKARTVIILKKIQDLRPIIWGVRQWRVCFFLFMWLRCCQPFVYRSLIEGWQHLVLKQISSCVKLDLGQSLKISFFWCMLPLKYRQIGLSGECALPWALLQNEAEILGIIWTA